MKSTQLRIALVIAVLAIAVVAVPSALAQSNGNDTRPGWGFGDTNHVHVGPPGQSVHPDNDKIVQKLEKKKDKIVNKLENNNKIPEPQKSNLISDIKNLFDKLIGFFS